MNSVPGVMALWSNLPPPPPSTPRRTRGHATPTAQAVAMPVATPPVAVAVPAEPTVPMGFAVPAAGGYGAPAYPAAGPGATAYPTAQPQVGYYGAPTNDPPKY